MTPTYRIAMDLPGQGRVKLRAAEPEVDAVLRVARFNCADGVTVEREALEWLRQSSPTPPHS